MQRYQLGLQGIPDNEDMGSNSGFFVAAALGLFPLLGQSYYLLLPPRFPEITLSVGPDRLPLRIRCEGKVESPDPVIRDAQWNGVPHPESWIEHRELVRGGELVLTLDNAPGDWGKQSPPSPLGHGGRL